MEGTIPGTDTVITFFRKGELKKFCLSNGATAREVIFLDAVDLFECGTDTRKLPIPKGFYPMLEQNKAAFDLLTSGETLEKTGHGSKSNETYIIKMLKSQEMRQFKGFTEEDEEFLKSVLKALEDGIIPKNTSKRLKDEIEREVPLSPLKVLAVLKKNIPYNLLSSDSTIRPSDQHVREVILSEYLIAGLKGSVG